MSNGPATPDMDQFLADQIEASYKTKGSKDYKTIFRTDVTLPTWKCGDGQHWIDIIPYRVGNFDPLPRSFKKGEIAYKLEYWYHKGIGMNENYLCLYKNYGKPCPVCEYVLNLKSNWNENKELIKKYNAKKRVIYNIICRDSNEEVKKGIQIWDVAHFFMEAKLLELAKNRPTFDISDQDSRGFIPFPSLKNGRHVGFTVNTKGDNYEYLAHSFEKRKAELPLTLMDKATSLDEIIHIPTYEEVDKALKLGLSSTAPTKAVDLPAPSTLESVYNVVTNPTDIGVVNKVINTTCPVEGGIMGDNTDDFPECLDCDKHAECEESYNAKHSV